MRAWGRGLSQAAGVRVGVLVVGPTEEDVLNSLKNGEIQVATLSPLAYGLARERGWAVAGLQGLPPGQDAQAIMFVSRQDSGLLPDDSDAFYAQLNGRRPCWPDLNYYTQLPPIYNYLVPYSLLVSEDVQLGEPFWVLPTDAAFPDLETPLFWGQCDFAAVEAIPPEFYDGWTAELSDAGVSLEEWAEQMQILHITAPLIPYQVVAFSSALPEDIRASLAQAYSSVPQPYSNDLLAFYPVNETIYQEFARLVAESELDLQSFLRYSPWLEQGEAQESSPLWVAAPPDTLVIDVSMDGGAPFMPFPSTSSAALNRLVLPAIYAELVRRDETGQYFPYLAAEVPTRENGGVRFRGQGLDEYLEVEFQLRSGAVWQDGAPLTADDLVFSWEFVMQPDWPGYHSGPAGWASEVYVDSVEALAPDRVVYRFMSARQTRQAARDGGRLGDPSIYQNLSEQSGPVVPLDYLDVGRNVLPRHLLQGVEPSSPTFSEFFRNPVYAGAYRLVSGNAEEGPVTLQAFDGFVLGAPRIPQVVFGPSAYSTADSVDWEPPQALREALAADALHAQLSLPAVSTRVLGATPQEYDQLAQGGLAAVNWTARAAWEVLDFNLDNPHLADLRVRQAIAYALDRQGLINQLLAGHGDLMDSYLPRWHPLHPSEGWLPVYAWNPAKARELLEESGYDTSRFPAVHPARGPLELRLATMDVAPYPRQPTTAWIQSQLEEVGIQVNVTFHEWMEFEGEDCSAIRNGRQFDLGLAGWLGIGLFPADWVEQSTASWNIPAPANECAWEHQNWSGWRNARVDEIIPLLSDGRLSLLEPLVYRELWAEHQLLWATELPSLPLFNLHRPVVVSPRLQGFQFSPLAFGEGVEDTWNLFSWFLNPPK